MDNRALIRLASAASASVNAVGRQFSAVGEAAKLINQLAISTTMSHEQAAECVRTAMTFVPLKPQPFRMTLVDGDVEVTGGFKWPPA